MKYYYFHLLILQNYCYYLHLSSKTNSLELHFKTSNLIAKFKRLCYKINKNYECTNETCIKLKGKFSNHFIAYYVNLIIDIYTYYNIEYLESFTHKRKGCNDTLPVK